MTTSTAPRRLAVALLATGLAVLGTGWPAAALPGGLPAALPPHATAAALPGTLPAADDATGTVSWSVRPANLEGPDGRSTIAVELEPGTSTTEHVAVRNLGDAAVTFTVSANDGYLTRNGHFDMRPSSHEPTDGGAWISHPATVDVGPGETMVVPFQVEVPADATPGDHPAGIAASVRSGEGTVSTESRVGVRVDVRVAGEVAAVLAARVAGTTYTPSWNPFEPGELELDVDLANEGNVRLTGDLDARVEGGLGTGASSARVPAETVGEILPGATRRVTVTVDGVWPTGRVGAEVTVVPAPVGEEGQAGTEADPAPVTAATTAWALPWPQLVLLVLVGIVVAVVLDDRRRRRRRLEVLLARARAEGRQEAATEVPSGPRPVA